MHLYDAIRSRRRRPRRDVRAATSVPSSPNDVPDLERFGWRHKRPLEDAIHWNAF
jgi:hypothetical protein